MIPASDVVDAVLTVLRAELGADLVGDHTAPAGNPAVYAVVESPPGTAFHGTAAIPEDGVNLVVRVRSVARSTTRGTARKSAQRTADRLAAALLDRTTLISGEGWTVSGRERIASSGVDAQGDLVNITDDYQLYVSR